MSENTTGRIAVIGTGIIGLATAWELLRRGWSVTVIGPRGLCGKGQATVAAGAMLSVFSEIEAGHSPDRIALETGERVEAHALWPELLGQLAEAGHRPPVPTPGTWVVGTADEHSVLTSITTTARQYGHPAEHHIAPTVPGLHRRTKPAGAVFLPTEQSLDVGVLMTVLGQAIDDHPAAEWEHDWAAELSGDDSGHPTVVCDGTRVVADRVVLAAGTGIPELLARSSLRVPAPTILTGRGTGLVVRTAHPPAQTIRTPNRDFSCGTHMLPLTHGLTYVGGTNRFQPTTAQITDATLDELASLIYDSTTEFDSRLEDAQLVEVRLGYRPYTLDRLPVVGPAADPRILFATATYRSGILLAPRIAQLIADDTVDPGCHHDHPYRPNRPTAPVDTTSLIHTAAPDLVDVLCGPGGHIAPWSTDRLTAFIRLALEAVITGELDNPAVDAIRALWQHAPVAEVMPTVQRMIAQQAPRHETEPCP
ncbi:NAD(P)/FAD-dependent oxidoreductase [Nocardia thraciensis]